METRKLCWVPSLWELEEAITLEEWEPYYLDYYTSHYFSCANQVVETYWQQICKATLNPDDGKIVVFKDDVNQKGSWIERPIKPLYASDLQKLNKRLSQLYYFKMLEKMDYYNFQKKKKEGYERFFLLEDYRGLQEITDLTDSLQKQNYDFIRKSVYHRVANRVNFYEIIRQLLSMKVENWGSETSLPARGEYISFSTIETVDSIAIQKQLTKKNLNFWNT